MASCSIFSREKAAPAKMYKELPRAKFYLVQLGREAKIRTLGLIEMLRRERIPVHHFLGKDKLSVQLADSQVPHRGPCQLDGRGRRLAAYLRNFLRRNLIDMLTSAVPRLQR